MKISRGTAILTVIALVLLAFHAVMLAAYIIEPVNPAPVELAKWIAAEGIAANFTLLLTLTTAWRLRRAIAEGGL